MNKLPKLLIQHNKTLRVLLVLFIISVLFTIYVYPLILNNYYFITSTIFFTLVTAVSVFYPLSFFNKEKEITEEEIKEQNRITFDEMNEQNKLNQRQQEQSEIG